MIDNNELGVVLNQEGIKQIVKKYVFIINKNV